MSFSTPPRNIVITGASAGIGAALAVAYARKGVVLGLLARNAGKLGDVSAACRAKGADIIEGVLDVRDTTVLVTWLTQFDVQYPVDLLIANAGVTSSIGCAGEPESWENICKVMDTNVYGVLGAVNAVLPAMRQRRNGHLVLISSLAAYRGLPVTPAYCASKAAVKNYGEALRGWLKRDGVKVTVICPGFVESDMSRTFPGSKPFLVPANKAVQLIQQGIQLNKACVSFPFPLNLGAWVLSVLPASLADKVTQWLGYGSRGKCN